MVGGQGEMGIWAATTGKGQGMSDRFRTRCGVVVLAGALSAFAGLPVAADSQIPGSDALKRAPAVPNGLELAGHKLEALKRTASAPQHSNPGNTRPAAPQRSTPAPSARPAPASGAASGNAVRQRATTSATGSHAGVGASTGSSSRASSARTAAKAGSAQARQADDAAPAAPAAARPTVVSPGSDVQNDPSLPFTGSRPLDVLALGLLALAIGLATRRTLRLR
jgi:hypothetical protein